MPCTREPTVLPNFLPPCPSRGACPHSLPYLPLQVQFVFRGDMGVGVGEVWDNNGEQEGQHRHILRYLSQCRIKLQRFPPLRSPPCLSIAPTSLFHCSSLIPSLYEGGSNWSAAAELSPGQGLITAPERDLTAPSSQALVSSLLLR